MHRSVYTLLCALLLLGTAAPAQAEVHVVTQVNLTFSPRDVIILPGDTVRWEWTSSTHTVTNGTGAGDPQAGAEFNAPLDSANPSFEWTYNTVGEHPYYCAPHEFFDMRGKVIVESPVPTEATTWGQVKKIFM